MRGFYAILDATLARAKEIDEIALGRALLSARPAALQLRAKDLSARETLALLRNLAPLCQRAKVPLVANDRADLATLAGCAAVHVGQDDLPYDLVTRIAPGLGVGISTHDLAQLDRALAMRPTYVAYGPVFATVQGLVRPETRARQRLGGGRHRVRSFGERMAVRPPDGDRCRGDRLQ